MSSDVEICNLALAHLGYDRGISSLEDRNSKESRLCRTFYQVALEAALRAHPWSFATKRVYLSELDEAHPIYGYVYRYPSNCLSARKLVTGTDRNEPFEVELSSDGKSRIIVCDIPQAILLYTSAVTDENLFDAEFVEALSFKIAALLSQPLTGNPNLGQMMEQRFQMVFSNAKTLDANEGTTAPRFESDFLDARD